MKLFYIDISIVDNEIVFISANSRGGHIDTAKIEHRSFGNTILVYGVVRVNNVKEAFDAGLKYIEENSLI